MQAQYRVRFVPLQPFALGFALLLALAVGGVVGYEMRGLTTGQQTAVTAQSAPPSQSIAAGIVEHSANERGDIAPGGRNFGAELARHSATERSESVTPSPTLAMAAAVKHSAQEHGELP